MTIATNFNGSKDNKALYQLLSSNKIHECDWVRGQRSELTRFKARRLELVFQMLSRPLIHEKWHYNELKIIPILKNN